MALRKFSRKTVGVNAQIFTAPAMAYTTDATLALFEANAPLGEIGVYDGNNALHDNAITSSEEFFVVQRTTQGIKRTPHYKWSDIQAVKKTYVAPIKQVSAVGWNRTGGSLNNATIAKDQTFNLKVIEMTEGNEPYPTWNYEYTTKFSDTIIDVLQAIAAKINDRNSAENKQNQRLVTAAVVADATYSNYAVSTGGTLTFTNGSTAVTLGGTTPTIDTAVGDYISFDPAAAPTDAVGDIYKVIAISAGVGFTLNRPFTGTTKTLTEAEAEGTRLKKAATFVNVGIELTSVDYDTFWRLAVSDALQDADITYTTPVTIGNGEATQVALMEKEGQGFAGDDAQNTAFQLKYGAQDTFVVSTETYDFIHLNFLRTEAGIAPYASESNRGSIILALGKSTGGLTASLATLFGV